MPRIFRFLLVASVFLALAWLVGNLPGTLTAQSGPYTIQTTLPVAILLIVVIIALLGLLLRLVAGARRAPGGLISWQSGRRRRLGDVAIERGLVALAAGDAAAAGIEAKRARRLVGDRPLAVMLAAESARLAGRPDEAAADFAKLAAHPHMAFLGHRGLLRHRLETGDHDAAADHAAAAAAHYPNSAWLRDQNRELAARRGDWPSALALARNPAETAAFATAAATATTDNAAALRFGKQAVKADPTLAPAVLALAAARRRAGDGKAAAKTLRAGWAAAPHPDLATAYLAAEAAPLDRARAAGDLAAARPGHPESELVLAQTALDARLAGEARRHAEAALAAIPADPRPAAILAALADGAAGAPAPLPPGWACGNCHARQPAWSPLCENCRTAGGLAWRPATAPLVPPATAGILPAAGTPIA